MSSSVLAQVDRLVKVHDRFGQDFAAVLKQWEDCERKHDYIAKCVDEDGHRFILLVNKDMAALAQQAASLYGDTTFKVIRGEFDMFVVGVWCISSNSMIAVARVITDNLDQLAHET